MVTYEEVKDIMSLCGLRLHLRALTSAALTDLIIEYVLISCVVTEALFAITNANRCSFHAHDR